MKDGKSEEKFRNKKLKFIGEYKEEKNGMVKDMIILTMKYMKSKKEKEELLNIKIMVLSNL